MGRRPEFPCPRSWEGAGAGRGCVLHSAGLELLGHHLWALLASREPSCPDPGALSRVRGACQALQPPWRSSLPEGLRMRGLFPRDFWQVTGPGGGPCSTSRAALPEQEAELSPAALVCATLPLNGF